ncbi:MAG: hypothetical protein ACI9DC_001184 [Gammaproteobacteria bacterium]
MIHALARVRALAVAEAGELAIFRDMLTRARRNAASWRSEHLLQVRKVGVLRSDLERLDAHLKSGALADADPWDRLYRWAEDHLSIEGQEQLVSLLLEPYGALVDELSERMAAVEHSGFAIDGSMRLDKLQAIVEDVYRWAIDIDWTDPDSAARVWYVSEEKLEPRLGERFEEPIEPYEQPLAPGRDAAAMHRDMTSWGGQPSVAAFLLRHPQHRHIARRAQITARFPYAEIRDNTISSELLPIDLLRCKLAFFGATHFDPRSDRWVRINMFQNAPFPDEMHADNADDWSYPSLNDCGQ